MEINIIFALIFYGIKQESIIYLVNSKILIYKFQIIKQLTKTLIS